MAIGPAVATLVVETLTLCQESFLPGLAIQHAIIGFGHSVEDFPEMSSSHEP